MNNSTLRLFVVLLGAATVLVFGADLSQVLEQGESLVRAGKVEEALQFFQGHATERVIDAPPVLLGQIARLLYESQDMKKTIAFVNDALNSGVKDPTLNYYRARVFFDQREEELDVIADLDVVLAANPDHIGANILKAMFLRQSVQEEGDEDGEKGSATDKDADKEVKTESDRLLKKGLGLNAVTADDYEQQAAGYMYEQDLDNAARLTQAAIALNPTRPPLFLIRCLVLVSQDDIEGGTKDCEKARILAKPGAIREAIDSVIELLQYAHSEDGGGEEEEEEEEEGGSSMHHHHHHHDHHDGDETEEEEESDDHHHGHAHGHGGHGGHSHSHHSHGGGGHSHEHGEACDHDHDDL